MKTTRMTLSGGDDIRLAADLREPAERTKKLAPVMLLHGGGQTRHSWDGTADMLAKCGHVTVTVDARGHGESDRSPGGDYRWELFAQDVIAIADQLAESYGQRPVAVGASMGGLSSLGAQTTRPGTLAAIALVDITPRMRPDGVDRILGFMADRATEGFESPEEAAEAIAGYLPHRPRPRSLAGLRKNLRRHDDGRYYWHWDPAFVRTMTAQAENRETRLEWLEEGVRSMTVPLMLVRGSRSELISDDEVAHFLELAPHTRVVDIRGAGHMVAGDRNDAFGDAVLDFLGELERTDA